MLPDSREYYLDAIVLLSSGYTPSSIFIHGLGPVQTVTGSSHPFYWYWNIVWISVIGDTIFAPIIANIFLSVVASVLAAGLLKRMDYPYRYQQWFLVFTLLHWDIIAWTTVTNLKDPLVATLTIACFYIVAVFLDADRRGKIVATIVVAAIFLIFTVVRFYIPIIMILATIVWWLLLNSTDSDLTTRLVPVCLGFTTAIGLFVFGSVNPDMGHILIKNLPIGLIQFPLTPTPWDIAVNYHFLTVPSLFHWVTIPFTLAGAVWLLSGRFEKLLIIYVIAVVGLYAILPDLLTPRHRLQLIYLIALMQFNGAWTILHRQYEIRLSTPRPSQSIDEDSSA
jgi:hypothetical protein